jgi:hypothetical protein
MKLCKAVASLVQQGPPLIHNKWGDSTCWYCRADLITKYPGRVYTSEHKKNCVWAKLQGVLGRTTR